MCRPDYVAPPVTSGVSFGDPALGEHYASVVATIDGHEVALCRSCLNTTTAAGFVPTATRSVWTTFGMPR